MTLKYLRYSKRQLLKAESSTGRQKTAGQADSRPAESRATQTKIKIKCVRYANETNALLRSTKLY